MFWVTILHCKAILGHPRLMRWILVWMIPQVQDRSLDLVTCSPTHYYCITIALFIVIKLIWLKQLTNNLFTCWQITCHYNTICQPKPVLSISKPINRWSIYICGHNHQDHNTRNVSMEPCRHPRCSRSVFVEQWCGTRDLWYTLTTMFFPSFTFGRTMSRWRHWCRYNTGCSKAFLGGRLIMHWI